MQQLERLNVPFLNSSTPAIRLAMTHRWNVWNSLSECYAHRWSFKRWSHVLHVDVPPQLEQHSEVADVSGSVYLTCRHVVAAVPWLCWPDVVKYLRVFAEPANQTVSQYASEQFATLCLLTSKLLTDVFLQV